MIRASKRVVVRFVARDMVRRGIVKFMVVGVVGIEGVFIPLCSWVRGLMMKVCDMSAICLRIVTLSIDSPSIADKSIGIGTL
jgi:hypothetical protein